MNEPEFRPLVDKILCPLLGAKLEPGFMISTKREKEESILQDGGGLKLALKPLRQTEYKLVIVRSQIFSADERKIAEAFCKEIGKIAELNSPEYEDELILGVSSRIIAKQYPKVTDTLQSVLHQFDLWASQTYEGRQITAAVGISPEAENESSSTLSEFWQQPFAPVLTNGYDTLLLTSTDTKVVKFEQLSLPDGISLLAPYRLQALVNWTTEDKIIVVLNQHGETLIFANQELRFAKRRGVWSHYYLESVMKRLYPPLSESLRKALLESFLDVSFSRSGACIGVIFQGESNTFIDDEIVSPGDMLSDDLLSEDMLSKGISLEKEYKVKLFAEVANKPFQELDRRLRQELLAIDGAFVLDHHGKILAIGAILKVKGGSEGGGRTLAAQTLSKFGFGIKISADGPITAYYTSAIEKKTSSDLKKSSILFSLG